MHSAAHFADTSRGSGLFRLPRRHVLMLAVAVEVLAFGALHADRYQRTPTIAVEAPILPGHQIT